MKKFTSIGFFICAVLIVFIPYTIAAEPKKIYEKRDWAAYVFAGEKGKICYIASAPKKQKGRYKKKNRGQPYALVTNRPAENIKGEVNFIAGYNYKQNSSVEVRINKKTFDLFTQQDGAWSREPAVDAKLVKAMKNGNRMTVIGTSSRGTKTTDTYSLSGFTAVKKRIDKACK
ncbi:MAG: hypothetical protein HN701_12285 [Rhodospirillaceae bacterium]|nr:hypothetical protein [Rhodospirillaceae bacterium]